MQGVEEHIGVVKHCVAVFESLVSAVATADPSAPALRDEVFQLESQSQQMRRDIDARIAEGAFFGGVREDILNLLGELDTVAKAAKDAARLLMMGTAGDASGLAILKNEHMAKFLANLMASLTSVEGLVKALQTNKKSVVNGARVVEEYEEAADTEKAALLTELFKLPRAIDPVVIIQLRDFIFAADDIADNSVNASDVLIVLVAKGYG
jgi:predicted phosphate transport protein (TIGR00153 family)